MASGRKNRGSRHRSHRQHHKQKVEDIADSDSEPSMRHGPLPESDSCSPWRMEPLPPHVEGPSALKQQDTAENADNHGFGRKVDHETQKGSHGASLKRKKEVAPDVDAAVSSPPSLDRWDGGQSHGDDTLSIFDFARGEPQAQEYDLLGNEVPVKEPKSEGDGKSRKGKSRAIAGTQTPINNGQVDSDATANVKTKVSRRRDFSEFLGNEVGRSRASDTDGIAVDSTKGPSLGMDAGDGRSNARKVGSSAIKKWEKGKDTDAEFQQFLTMSSDVSIIESERKRGKISESLPKAKKMEDITNEVEQLNAFVDAEKGSSIQNDHRNLELEKELENRIRRRREESGERDKGKEGRRPYYQEDDRGKVEGTQIDKLKDDKHRHEKVKDDGLGETEKSDSKHTGKPAEDKHKEEKLKVDRERFVKLKDDKEHDQRSNLRKDKEEGAFEKNSKNDRHREEKHRDEERDDRPADTKDIKVKESKLRPRDKDKEGRLKEEKYQEGILNVEPFKALNNKSQGLFEGRKDEKERDSGEVSRDNYRRGRERDKDDRLKGKDRGEKFERFKDEKVKEEKEKGVKHRVELDRDGIADYKGGYGKRKSEKEHDDAYKQREELDREVMTENKGKYDKHKFGKERVDDAVIVKYQREKQKVDRLQDGNLADGRGKDDKYKASREGDGRWREERGKESKLQAHKDRDAKHKDDVIKPKKHEQVIGDRRRQEKDDNEKERHDRWKDAREERHVKLRDDREERGQDQVVHDERKKSTKDVGDSQKNAREKDDRQGFETRTDGRKVTDKSKEGIQGKVYDRGDVRMETTGKSIDGAQAVGKSMDETPLDVKVLDPPNSEPIKADDLVVDEGTKDLSTLGKKGLRSHGLTKEVVLKTSRDAEQDQTDDQGVAKASRDDRPMSRSVAMLGSTPERLQEATIMLTGMDATSVERDPESGSGPGNRLAEEKDGFLDDDSHHRRSQEQRVSPFDALPRSPSPFHHSVHEKAARRAETSISVSSSSGTRRPRERSRRVSEHLDPALQQQHGLEEEVRSWEPRMRSQDDRRGRSWSPDRYRDSQSSPSPRGSRAKGHEEPLGDRMRGSTPYEDGTAHERDHRRFGQGGGPTKVRRLDEPSRDRSERIYQGPHSSRLPADRLLPPNRMSGPSGLLPPPPPFRPGIDNPAVLGNSAHSFDEGPGPRDGGRYDRKSGGPFRRSEMPGSGETWRAVPMGNWQGHGPGPGGMFPPYGSGGFFGMGQQLPMPPFFGRNGMRPSTEMGFGGARFHMGDGVGFPGHTPNLGPVMGWHRPGEGDDSRFPLSGPLDAWEGQGLYLDERQRFGLPDWDQGFPGRGFQDPWQGQAGDGGFGFNNPQLLVRETAGKGRTEDTPNQDIEEIQAVKEHAFDVMTEVRVSKEMLPANVTDGVFKVGLMTGTRSRQRMQAVLQSIDVSVKLAGVDLYKQYLDLLSPSEAKRREALLIQRELLLDPIDEDLQFEADPEAQDLLTSSDHCAELLPLLQDGAFKEAFEIYQKPAQENRVQKSLFGSFLLPLDSYAIKLPSPDAEAVLELGEKIISHEVVDEDLDATPLSEASLEDHISEEVMTGSKGTAVLLNEGKYEDPIVQNMNEVYFEDPVEQNNDGLIDTGEEVLAMSAPMELLLVQDTSNEAVDLAVDYSCVPDEARCANEDNVGQVVKSEFLLETGHVDLPTSVTLPVAEHETVSVEVLAVTKLTFESVCGVREMDEVSPSGSECNHTNFCVHAEVTQLNQREDSDSPCAQPIQRDDPDCQFAQPIEREDSDSQSAQLIKREDCASQCKDDDEPDTRATALPNTRMELQEVAGLEASLDSEIDDDPKGKSRLGKSPEKACENTH